MKVASARARTSAVSHLSLVPPPKRSVKEILNAFYERSKDASEDARFALYVEACNELETLPASEVDAWINARAREQWEAESLTKEDVSDLAGDLAERLGWSKARVMAEALMQFADTVYFERPYKCHSAEYVKRPMAVHRAEARARFARLLGR